jgi:ribosomal protein S18 acetylase RimI-like enzyme
VGILPGSSSASSSLFHPRLHSTLPTPRWRVPLGQLVEQPGHVPFGVQVMRQAAQAAEFLLDGVQALGVGHTTAFLVFAGSVLPNRPRSVRTDAAAGRDRRPQWNVHPAVPRSAGPSQRNTTSMTRSRASVRPSTTADDDAIRNAIVQVQDFERGLHDTRRPGAEIADAYFDFLRARVEQQHGAIFVAEVGNIFVGFVACWITANSTITETPDSNTCGYISDVGVVPDFRGQGIAADLLKAAQEHLASFGVRRLRIVSLAANASAQRAYLKYGFEPYEIIFEKRI